MSELVIFETNGEQVAFDPSAQMWSLTAMHQAAGATAMKAPKYWLRQAQTQEFMAALAARLAERAGLKVIQDHIYNESGDVAELPEITTDELVQTRPGRYGGGTWAHWQIAAAYAHYLNPAFYLQWNEWALERATGQQPAPSVSAPSLAVLEARIAALEARSHGPITIERATLAFDGSALHPQTQAILAVLAAADGGPLAGYQILAALRRAAVPITKATQVRVRLRRMAARGQLRRCGRGTYALPSE